jgi:hypothetical protein
VSGLLSGHKKKAPLRGLGLFGNIELNINAVFGFTQRLSRFLKAYKHITREVSIGQPSTSKCSPPNFTM